MTWIHSSRTCCRPGRPRLQEGSQPLPAGAWETLSSNQALLSEAEGTGRSACGPTATSNVGEVTASASGSTLRIQSLPGEGGWWEGDGLHAGVAPAASQYPPYPPFRGSPPDCFCNPALVRGSVSA